MAEYVAFLRAINLGKHRKFPMADLRRCLSETGFTGVETHIHTGNVRLTTSMRSRSKVEAELEKLFATTTGFEVPTMAYTPAELAALLEGVAAVRAPAERHYLALLKTEPSSAAVREIESASTAGEGAMVVGRGIYWWLDHPTASARLSNTRLEKLVGPATTRDLKVVTKLVEKWCS